MSRQGGEMWGAWGSIIDETGSVFFTFCTDVMCKDPAINSVANCHQVHLTSRIFQFCNIKCWSLCSPQMYVIMCTHKPTAIKPLQINIFWVGGVFSFKTSITSDQIFSNSPGASDASYFLFFVVMKTANILRIVFRMINRSVVQLARWESWTKMSK